jgi:nucleoside-diphosphate-sugar epimerase
MRVLVTGASGWIGTATVAELLGNGHEVVGLARSDEAAATIEALGATVARGSLDDPGGIADLASTVDGVVHLAFQHDIAFSGGYAEAADTDRRTVELLGAALRGSDRPLVIASGLLGVAPGEVATERDGLHVPPGMAAAGARHATALLALSLRGIGVRASVLRLPPTVHGQGDSGFVASLVAAARQHQVAGYVGDGTQRWPAVHRTDAARLVRLALEGAPAGTVLHAVADEGVEIKAMAAIMSAKLEIPTASIPVEDALGHFGPIGMFAAMDSPASGVATQALLDWTPTGPTLLEDLDAGWYF